MKLLLDTRAFLWAAGDPDELLPATRAAIEDRQNEVLISAAVAWEISIKATLGKLTLPAAPVIWLPARVRSLGFQSLDISTAHALAVGRLPDIHRDPFDRIMIAQAQCEGLTLVTRDPDSLRYPVNVLAA
jgi:PIN domain nuclease of toxin-antitoxin system